ncbi:MAG: NADH-quinone oxidoreductase subunit H [Candidatus Delongbacteria bacterium]|nr:NADH-quinone oxidoreductase subunit H [Candidatus Delongbacteria bacterium]MCG2761437.1 NADH-quinone oxidoreductase subunit H [Candidatus Delongbacteria bacterium]
MENIWIKLFYALMSMLLIFNYGMLLAGVVLKIVARVHGRFGPPVWQPYVNLLKVLSVRSAISHGIMFYLGPVFRLAGGIGLFLFMPVVFGSVWLQNFSFSGDLLLVIYFIFFGQLGMALGAAESGHPYSPMGIMRGLAQVSVSEVPFALAVIAIAAQHGTMSITEIVAAQQGGFLHWNMVTNPVATLAGMMAFLGMMMNSPFDLHLAPQEIPVGPPTEYHSTFLGFMQANRAFFASAKLILFMNLFFGGATNIPILVLKTFLLYMVSVFVGVVNPRFKLEDSLRWFIKIPTVTGIIAVLIYTF